MNPITWLIAISSLSFEPLSLRLSPDLVFAMDPRIFLKPRSTSSELWNTSGCCVKIGGWGVDEKNKQENKLSFFIRSGIILRVFATIFPMIDYLPILKRANACRIRIVYRTVNKTQPLSRCHGESNMFAEKAPNPTHGIWQISVSCRVWIIYTYLYTIFVWNVYLYIAYM